MKMAATGFPYTHVPIRAELLLRLPSSLPRKSLKIESSDLSADERRWGANAFSEFNRTGDRQSLAPAKPNLDGSSGTRTGISTNRRRRVFFLDVNPLCYEGSTPSLRNFGRWVSLFFSQVSHGDPVIAVIDGERGSEHRRRLLPSYKAHRKKFSRYIPPSRKIAGVRAGQSSLVVIKDVLSKCNVPVIQVEGQEADDVVATLVDQVLQKGYRAVIASPDKDFKQLLSDDVQIVMPVPELGRWSFYTLKHYIAQYNCDPSSDLSLRCILGDAVDGVPGLQHLAPAFGRKTAVKLLKKHGSLENLLNAAAVRTVGKQYAQDALKMHADHLRRNYEVLALKRDVNVLIPEELLVERNISNDSVAFSDFFKLLQDMEEGSYRSRSHSSNAIRS